MLDAQQQIFLEKRENFICKHLPSRELTFLFFASTQAELDIFKSEDGSAYEVPLAIRGKFTERQLFWDIQVSDKAQDSELPCLALIRVFKGTQESFLQAQTSANPKLLKQYFIAEGKDVLYNMVMAGSRQFFKNDEYKSNDPMLDEELVESRNIPCSGLILTSLRQVYKQVRVYKYIEASMIDFLKKKGFQGRDLFNVDITREFELNLLEPLFLRERTSPFFIGCGAFTRFS